MFYIIITAFVLLLSACFTTVSTDEPETSSQETKPTPGGSSVHMSQPNESTDHLNSSDDTTDSTLSSSSLDSTELMYTYTDKIDSFVVLYNDILEKDRDCETETCNTIYNQAKLMMDTLNQYKSSIRYTHAFVQTTTADVWAFTDSTITYPQGNYYCDDDYIKQPLFETDEYPYTIKNGKLEIILSDCYVNEMSGDATTIFGSWLLTDTRFEMHKSWCNNYSTNVPMLYPPSSSHRETLYTFSPTTATVKTRTQFNCYTEDISYITGYHHDDFRIIDCDNWSYTQDLGLKVHHSLEWFADSIKTSESFTYNNKTCSVETMSPTESGNYDPDCDAQKTKPDCFDEIFLDYCNDVVDAGLDYSQTQCWFYKEKIQHLLN